MTIAPKLRQYLDEHHADYDLVIHPPTKSAMQSAAVSHIPAEQLAKAVLLDTYGEYLLAVLPSDCRIQLADLRAELGQKPRLADEEEISMIFDDCSIGAVPAFGSSYGIVTIVDDALEAEPEIYFEAGDHASLIHMDQAEFVRLAAESRHGRFSERWSAME
ncbi:hypothetical protein ACFB49_00670 [Sphingomonas sp. DBB INV C78]|uniref:aminoacyl-tRNA deacylase n=1 Tax=Sphingomonas sp. DBB INV C78 TaxID=3349434 RepID=UPI0036D271D4